MSSNIITVGHNIVTCEISSKLFIEQQYNVEITLTIRGDLAQETMQLLGPKAVGWFSSPSLSLQVFPDCYPQEFLPLGSSGLSASLSLSPSCTSPPPTGRHRRTYSLHFVLACVLCSLYIVRYTWVAISPAAIFPFIQVRAMREHSRLVQRGIHYGCLFRWTSCLPNNLCYFDA